MSDNLQFSGELVNNKGSKIATTLAIVNFKDSGSQIIYSPALEVYGYGKTIIEAKDSFKVCLQEFFNYAINKKTLEPELKKLGWKIKGKPANRSYKVPSFHELIGNNERLQDILDNKKVKIEHEEYPLAV